MGLALRVTDLCLAFIGGLFPHGSISRTSRTSGLKIGSSVGTVPGG